MTAPGPISSANSSGVTGGSTSGSSGENNQLKPTSPINAPQPSGAVPSILATNGSVATGSSGALSDLVVDDPVTASSLQAALQFVARDGGAAAAGGAAALSLVGMLSHSLGSGAGSPPGGISIQQPQPGITPSTQQAQSLLPPTSPRFSITTIEGGSTQTQPPQSMATSPEEIPVIYHRTSFVTSPNATIATGGPGPNSAVSSLSAAIQQQQQNSGAISQQSAAGHDLADAVANVTISSAVDEEEALHALAKNKSESERIIEYGGSNNRYAKLNTILGKGAYKVVWKALDREEGIEVAWNVLQTSKSEFAEFSSEIDILKRVRHANIINFHESWFRDGEFIFITELMTSGTLREYIRKLQTSSLKIIKRWARQILKGLQYLHAHAPPIIHRDIKCDNIFINGSSGEVKIGDMGTAKMKFGKKYTVIGTPEFMAPEMYEEKGYSEKVDIYAFGMCVLEMVTGEYPYGECKNAAQIYKKVSQGIKPECLQRVEDAEILSMINCCICAEQERWPARKLIEHPFFTDDPEVTLLSASPQDNSITFQVAFRGGQDRHAIKFDYNLDKDTIEEVVQEMIDEQVLSMRFKSFVIGELQKTLKDFARFRHLAILSSFNYLAPPAAAPPPTPYWSPYGQSPGYFHQQQMAAMYQAPPQVAIQHEAQSGAQSVIDHASTQQPRRPRTITRLTQEEIVTPPTGTALLPTLFTPTPPSAVLPQVPQLPFCSSGSYVVEAGSVEHSIPIEPFVVEVTQSLGRDPSKAGEWIMRLKAQDIQTVADLRSLQEDDWNRLGLTVFAIRVLKNAVKSGMPTASAPATNITQTTLMSPSMHHMTQPTQAPPSAMVIPPQTQFNNIAPLSSPTSTSNPNVLPPTGGQSSPTCSATNSSANQQK